MMSLNNFSTATSEPGTLFAEAFMRLPFDDDYSEHLYLDNPLMITTPVIDQQPDIAYLRTLIVDRMQDILIDAVAALATEIAYSDSTEGFMFREVSANPPNTIALRDMIATDHLSRYLASYRQNLNTAMNHRFVPFLNRMSALCWPVVISPEIINNMINHSCLGYIANLWYNSCASFETLEQTISRWLLNRNQQQPFLSRNDIAILLANFFPRLYTYAQKFNHLPTFMITLLHPSLLFSEELLFRQRLYSFDAPTLAQRIMWGLNSTHVKRLQDANAEEICLGIYRTSLMRLYGVHRPMHPDEHLLDIETNPGPCVRVPPGTITISLSCPAYGFQWDHRCNITIFAISSERLRCTFGPTNAPSVGAVFPTDRRIDSIEFFLNFGAPEPGACAMSGTFKFRATKISTRSNMTQGILFLEIVPTHSTQFVSGAASRLPSSRQSDPFDLASLQATMTQTTQAGPFTVAPPSSAASVPVRPRQRPSRPPPGFEPLPAYDPDDWFEEHSAVALDSGVHIHRSANATLVGQGTISAPTAGYTTIPGHVDPGWNYSSMMGKKQLLSTGTWDATGAEGDVLYGVDLSHALAVYAKAFDSYLYCAWSKWHVRVTFNATQLHAGMPALSVVPDNVLMVNGTDKRRFTAGGPGTNNSEIYNLRGVSSPLTRDSSLEICVPFWQMMDVAVVGSNKAAGVETILNDHSVYLWIRSKLRAGEGTPQSIQYNVWTWFDDFVVTVRQPLTTTEPNREIFFEHGSSSSKNEVVNNYTINGNHNHGGNSSADGGASSSQRTDTDANMEIPTFDNPQFDFEALDVFPSQCHRMLKAACPRSVEQFSLSIAQLPRRAERFQDLEDEDSFEYLSQRFCATQTQTSVYTVESANAEGTVVATIPLAFADPNASEPFFIAFDHTAYGRCDFEVRFEFVPIMFHAMKFLVEVIYGPNEVATTQATLVAGEFGGENEYSVIVPFRAPVPWIRSHDLELVPNTSATNPYLTLTSQKKPLSYATVRLTQLTKLEAPTLCPQSMDIIITYRAVNQEVAVPSRAVYFSSGLASGDTPYTDWFGSHALPYSTNYAAEDAVTPTTEEFREQMNRINEGVMPVLRSRASTMADHGEQNSYASGAVGMEPPRNLMSMPQPSGTNTTTTAETTQGSEPIAGTSATPNTQSESRPVPDMSRGEPEVSVVAALGEIPPRETGPGWFGDMRITMRELMKRQVILATIPIVTTPTNIDNTWQVLAQIAVTPSAFPTGSLVKQLSGVYTYWVGSIDYHVKLTQTYERYDIGSGAATAESFQSLESNFILVYRPGVIIRDGSSDIISFNHTTTDASPQALRADPTLGGVLLASSSVNNTLSVSVPCYTEYRFLRTVRTDIGAGEHNGVLEVVAQLPRLNASDSAFQADVLNQLTISASIGDDFRFLIYNGLRSYSPLPAVSNVGLPIKALGNSLAYQRPTPSSSVRVDKGGVSCPTFLCRRQRRPTAPPPPAYSFADPFSEQQGSDGQKAPRRKEPGFLEKRALNLAKALANDDEVKAMLRDCLDGGLDLVGERANVIADQVLKKCHSTNSDFLTISNLVSTFLDIANLVVHRSLFSIIHCIAQMCIRICQHLSIKATNIVEAVASALELPSNEGREGVAEDGSNEFEEQAGEGFELTTLSRLAAFLKTTFALPGKLTKTDLLGALDVCGRVGRSAHMIRLGGESTYLFFQWICKSLKHLIATYILKDPEVCLGNYLAKNPQKIKDISSELARCTSRLYDTPQTWSREYRQTVEDLASVLDYVPTSHLTPQELVSYRRMRGDLYARKRMFKEHPMTLGVKLNPFCFYLYGDSGIGKSGCLPQVESELFKRLGMGDPSNPDLTYCLPNRTDHLSGLKPTVKVIRFDDYCQFASVDALDIQTHFEVKSNAIWYPEMPDLTDKGIQPNPWVLSMASNVKVPFCNELRMPKALTNRIDEKIHVTLDPQYRSLKDVPREVKRVYGHLRFAFFEKQAAGGHTDRVQANTVDFDTFTRILCNRAADYIHNQREYLRAAALHGHLTDDLRVECVLDARDAWDLDKYGRIKVLQKKERALRVAKRVSHTYQEHAGRGTIKDLESSGSLDESSFEALDDTEETRTVYRFESTGDFQQDFEKVSKFLDTLNNPVVEGVAFSPGFSYKPDQVFSRAQVIPELELDQHLPSTSTAPSKRSGDFQSTLAEVRKDLGKRWAEASEALGVEQDALPDEIAKSVAYMAEDENFDEAPTPGFWQQAKEWGVERFLRLRHQARCLEEKVRASRVSRLRPTPGGSFDSIGQTLVQKASSTAGWIKRHPILTGFASLLTVAGAALTVKTAMGLFKKPTMDEEAGFGRGSGDPNTKHRSRHRVSFRQQDKRDSGGITSDATMERILSAARRDVVHVRTDDGAEQYAIAVSAKALVTTAHFVANMKGSTKLTIKRYSEPYGTTVYVSDCKLARIEGEEVAMIVMPKQLVFRSGSKGSGQWRDYILYDREIDNINSGAGVIPQWNPGSRETIVHLPHFQAIRRAVFVPSSEVLQDKLMQEGFKYSSFLTHGHCGLPLFAPAWQQGALIGFHCLGNKTTGISVPISVEALDALWATIPKEHVIEYAESFPLAPLDEECFVFDENALYPQGKVERPLRLPYKTTLQPSPLSGIFQEPLTGPAVLHHQDERWDKTDTTPLRQSFEKFVGPTVLFPPEDVATVQEFFTIKYQSCVPQRKVARMLSVQEAVSPPLLPGYNGMDVHTSEGYPHTLRRPRGYHNGSWAFAQDSSGRNMLTDPTIQFDAEERCSNARKGIAKPTVFIATLKDERRPLEKVTKPRLFMAGPKDFTIFGRQHLLDFMVALSENRLKLLHGVGTNPHSNEWELWKRKLLEVGDRFVVGDFSRFDGMISHQVMAALFEACRDWYSFYGFTGHDGCYEALMQDHSRPTIIVDNILAEVARGEPSGSPVTAPFNTEYNHWLFALAWLEIMRGTELQGLAAFWDHCRCLTYGDDVVMTVSLEAICRFNFHSVRDFFATHGIVFTNPTKCLDKEDPPYVSLEEVTFLKRRFVDLEHRVAAPMEEEAVYEIPNWVRKNGVASEEETMHDMLSNFLNEMVHFGPARFREVRDVLNRHLSDLGYDLMSHQYQDLIDHFYT